MLHVGNAATIFIMRSVDIYGKDMEALTITYYQSITMRYNHPIILLLPMINHPGFLQH